MSGRIIPSARGGQNGLVYQVPPGDPGDFPRGKGEGSWGDPKLIVSRFAGEPTLDEAGNLYFVHHYFEGDQMIEADIYVAYKK
jgi:hypothetical protein